MKLKKSLHLHRESIATADFNKSDGVNEPSAEKFK